ncbi:MAG: ferredoxin [Actinobacteria bacterium]|nr:ferredoxin [Actinomycetota bacterium]
MALEIRVDRGRCIGSRSCCNAAEGVFLLDEDNVAVARDASAAPEPDVLRAAAGCPTMAISVYRDGRRLG